MTNSRTPNTPPPAARANRLGRGTAPQASSSGKAGATPAADGFDVLDWTFPSDRGSERRCLVIVPQAAASAERFPTLVALHGLGETVDAKTGSRGWLESYELDATIDHLTHPPLAEDAFNGLVDPERLAQINGDLARSPYRGLVIACPYLPKEIGGDVPFDTYATWLSDTLLPRLRRETPIRGTPASTGIDGVSLGGITAIRLGLLRPDVFGAIGALQPAVNDVAGAESLAESIAGKLDGRPLRIVTSTEDVYRATLVALDQKLSMRGVAHEFAITPGPHDYPWNRGPGGIEMLLWHDRVLRRG